MKILILPGCSGGIGYKMHIMSNIYIKFRIILIYSFIVHKYFFTIIVLTPFTTTSLGARYAPVKDYQTGHKS